MTEPSPEDGAARFAELDLDRARRRGYPEAVLLPGQDARAGRAIAAALREHGARTLFTRAAAAHAAAVLAELPDALHAADCGLLAWPPDPPEPVGGRVLVVAAGTSDHAVAREALLTARHLGRAAELVMDVGVAGLHRVLRPAGRAAGGAGDRRRGRHGRGAPGAWWPGWSRRRWWPCRRRPATARRSAASRALLTMLNSCAPGVAVVNIDNGYGAGHLAAQIAAPS